MNINITELKAVFLGASKTLFVITTVIACFLLAVIGPMFMPYAASSKIMVERGVFGAAQEMNKKQGPRELLTITEVMKSRYFMEDAAKKLDFKTIFPKTDPAKQLQSMIEIAPMKRTNIIRVTASSYNPRLAAKIANTFSELVIEHSTKERFAFAKSLMKWLEEEAKDVKREIRSSRERMLKFQEASGITDVETAYRSLNQSLAQLQRRLENIKQRKEEANANLAILNELLAGGTVEDELPQVLTDERCLNLKKKIELNASKIEELLSIYNPDHPQIQELRKDISTDKESIIRRKNKIIEDIRHLPEQIAFEEKNTMVLAGERKQRLEELRGKLNEYNSYVDDLKEKEILYDTFLKRLSKDIMPELKIQNVSLAEPAYLPRRRKSLPLPLVLFIGALAGIGACVVRAASKEKGGIKALLLKKAKDMFSKGKKEGIYIERVDEGTQQKK